MRDAFVQLGKRYIGVPCRSRSHRSSISANLEYREQ
jgi:hypothetical protein